MEEAGYPANLLYWISKVAISRMTYKLADELKKREVAVVALAPRLAANSAHPSAL
jgi:NAD(P)-dependent dehydrogenase (short-subunit alcohol dehydrogenase family)